MAIRSSFRFPKSATRSSDLIRRILIGLLIAIIFLAGIQLRRSIGDTTRHVRYQHDIVNGFYWGSEVLKEARRLSPDESSANSWTGFCRGYLALYDRVKDKAYEKEYGLDYAPLRLLAMSIWAKEVRDGFPWVDNDHPKLVNPLLKINFICELVSALAIFLLVRECLRRSRPTQSSLLNRLPQQHRGWICGLGAASAAWLEPSMILDAHGWPQWDVWILPFYLFAALAALKNRWFWCGCLVAAGAMLKGQLLFVAPFFVFWPLWQKRWTSTLRVLAGFAATSALIASPWLLRTPASWIAIAAVAGISLPVFLKYKVPHGSAWLAGIIGCAVFVISVFTRGSFAWLQVGFIYGTEHYPYLFISSCYNLPSLLSKVGWSLKESFLSAAFGLVHFVISLASTAMIVHVMLIDKKLDATLPAIDALKHIRPYGSVVVLACVAVYLWNTFSTRLPVFQHREVRSRATPSVSLGPEPEEA